MFLRVLGIKPKPNLGTLRAKLPALHAFVDISMPRGLSGSVSIDAIAPKTIATAVVPGLTVGSVAIFVYTNPAGKFRFATKCIAITGSQAIFDLPKSIETLQRASGAGDGAQKRTTVRLDTTVPAQWRYASGGKGNGEFMRGSLTDISRSGASLISDREISKGSQVEVRLALNSDSAPLMLLSEVMRTSKIERSGKHSLGLRFHGMSQADDRAVMEFINKRQAERRSRGLA
ncbi:MAG: hypothetical protein NVS2B17_26300 [Candidatus Velthaea sp.]